MSTEKPLRLIIAEHLPAWSNVSFDPTQPGKVIIEQPKWPEINQAVDRLVEGLRQNGYEIAKRRGDQLIPASLATP